MHFDLVPQVPGWTAALLTTFAGLSAIVLGSFIAFVAPLAFVVGVERLSELRLSPRIARARSRTSAHPYR